MRRLNWLMILALTACAGGAVSVTDEAVDSDTTTSDEDGGGSKDKTKDKDSSETDDPTDTDVEDDTGSVLTGAPLLSRTWGAPVLIEGVNSPSHDVDGTMTADLLRLCFASKRPGGGGSGYDLWCATRPTPSDAFSPPAPLTLLNTSSDEAQPTLSADGSELFFMTNRDGTQDLYRATWDAGASTYANEQTVTELNTEFLDRQPSLSAGGRVLVFGSDRSGSDEAYWATRPAAGSAFDSVTAIAGLAADGAVVDPALAANRQSLVFASFRPWPSFSTAFTQQLWAVDGTRGTFANPYLLVFDQFDQPSMSGASQLSDGTLLFSATHGSNRTLNDDQDLYIAAPLAGVVDGRGRLPRTFTTSDLGVAHITGSANGDTWTAVAGVDATGNMQYGPYTRQIPGGARTASFNLRVEATSTDTTSVANIDVYTPTTGELLGSTSLSWDAFSSTGWQLFDIPFTNVEGNRLEFRVYFKGVVTLSIESVTVR